MWTDISVILIFSLFYSKRLQTSFMYKGQLRFPLWIVWSFFFAHIYVSYWSFAFQYLRALYIKESSLLSVASLSLQTFLQFCHFSVDLACGDLFVLNLFFLVLGVMETYVVWIYQTFLSWLLDFELRLKRPPHSRVIKES